ncbi:unnamed protein product, partial [Ectocarpus sp. 12 AP-2014]
DQSGGASPSDPTAIQANGRAERRDTNQASVPKHLAWHRTPILSDPSLSTLLVHNFKRDPSSQRLSHVRKLEACSGAHSTRDFVVASFGHRSIRPGFCPIGN